MRLTADIENKLSMKTYGPKTQKNEIVGENTYKRTSVFARSTFM